MIINTKSSGRIISNAYAITWKKQLIFTCYHNYAKCKITWGKGFLSCEHKDTTLLDKKENWAPEMHGILSLALFSLSVTNWVFSCQFFWYYMPTLRSPCDWYSEIPSTSTQNTWKCILQRGNFKTNLSMHHITNITSKSQHLWNQYVWIQLLQSMCIIFRIKSVRVCLPWLEIIYIHTHIVTGSQPTITICTFAASIKKVCKTKARYISDTYSEMWPLPWINGGFHKKWDSTIRLVVFLWSSIDFRNSYVESHFLLHRLSFPEHSLALFLWQIFVGVLVNCGENFCLDYIASTKNNLTDHEDIMQC